MVTANVFGNDGRFAVVGFGIDIKALTVIFIDIRLHFFERRTDSFVKMIEESSTKRFAQKRIVKVGKAFPRSNATDSDFGNEDMDVRIPLKAAAEGVEDTDKTGSKTFGFVNLAEHTKNDITNRIKETVE